jgi:hypothetical protein
VFPVYIPWVSTATAKSATSEVRHHVVIPTVEPRPEDVNIIDGIIRASYETIPDLPGSHGNGGVIGHSISRMSTMCKVRKVIPQGMTCQEYADKSGPDLEEHSYFECEIGRSIQVFGHRHECLGGAHGCSWKGDWAGREQHSTCE